jgi:hypothetical protein
MIKDFFKNISNIKTIIGFIITISSLSVGGYMAYIDILSGIENNKIQLEEKTANLLKELEYTEILVLKTIVKNYENLDRNMTDIEYEDYVLNLTKLYLLKKKYNMIPPGYEWKPVAQYK